jgi:hypothetical protein
VRINDKDETMDMEARDFNYILPAYVRAYMYYQKNELPKAIIWPMFRSVPNPLNPAETIPVIYVELESERAKDISQDGAEIPEATEEVIAKADEEEDRIKALTDKIEELEKELQERPDMFEIAKNSVNIPEIEDIETESTIGNPNFDINSLPPMKEGRTPKLPDHPAVGSPDGMQSRDARADSLIKKDLMIGDDLGEDESEVPYEKNISRDADGNPVVED